MDLCHSWRKQMLHKLSLFYIFALQISKFSPTSLLHNCILKKFCLQENSVKVELIALSLWRGKDLKSFGVGASPSLWERAENQVELCETQIFGRGVEQQAKIKKVLNKIQQEIEKQYICFAFCGPLTLSLSVTFVTSLPLNGCCGREQSLKIIYTSPSERE